jgi:hypothetical protein
VRAVERKFTNTAKIKSAIVLSGLRDFEKLVIMGHSREFADINGYLHVQ